MHSAAEGIHGFLTMKHYDEIHQLTTNLHV
jgi:hypothetical protein